MRKWLYVLSIAVIIGALIFYYISTQSLVNGLKADSLALIESLNKKACRKFTTKPIYIKGGGVSDK
jgi:hypothetical protein